MVVFSMHRYLLEHGANVAAVNNDGELPYDIADGDDLENLLKGAINKLGEQYLSNLTFLEQIICTGWLGSVSLSVQPSEHATVTMH